MKLAIELYNPETGEVVSRKYFTSSREFDKFMKDYEEGRWRGLEWRYAEKEKPRKELHKMTDRKMAIRKSEWRDFVDNVRKHDIAYMREYDRELTEADLARIWKDILEHEKLAKEFAPEDERGEVISEFEEIKKRFHEIAGDRIFTVWDAEKVMTYMALTGIEYPAEPDFIMRTQKYSFNHVGIDVTCGETDRDTRMEEKKEMLSRCVDEVKKTIMCEYDMTFFDDDVPSSVAMWCAVEGRRVPVEFNLKLKEDWIKEEWEIMY